LDIEFLQILINPLLNQPKRFDGSTATIINSKNEQLRFRILTEKSEKSDLDLMTTRDIAIRTFYHHPLFPVYYRLTKGQISSLFTGSLYLIQGKTALPCFTD